MKWFHHECAARHDSKIQILGSSHGAEGVGIYWGLLEEIGQHSDTFHLKVVGVDKEIDQKFTQIVQNAANAKSGPFGHARNIPVLPLKILARNLFTSPKKLIMVIATSAEIGLFDLQKWATFGVLYSQSFEHRADDYTKRLQRKTEKIRMDSEQFPENLRIQSELSPDIHRQKSENVLTETDANKTEREESEIDMHAGEMTKQEDAPVDYELLKDEPYLVELDDNGYQEYCRTFRLKIVMWNEEHRNKFNWNPMDSELRKLFLGGSRTRKVSMCYESYKLLHEKVHYPELVLRALQLMLKASEKTRIANPVGWLWSCLHGNGDGTTPWVQLLTAEEESNVGSLLRRRTTTSHPP